jgi:predicted nucleotidyltransferase
LNAATGLDLSPRWLDEVQAILVRHVPMHEVWAFGSRVKGTASEASDLDLVVRNPTALGLACSSLSRLRADMAASALPIRVDVVDWARLPETFREEVLKAYLIVRVGGENALAVPKAT